MHNTLFTFFLLMTMVFNKGKTRFLHVTMLKVLFGEHLPEHMPKILPDKLNTVEKTKKKKTKLKSLPKDESKCLCSYLNMLKDKTLCASFRVSGCRYIKGALYQNIPSSAFILDCCEEW